MVTDKLKTLLGNRNVNTILIGLIKYSILCLLFRFVNPWIVSSIWLVVAAFISFCMLYHLKEEEGLSTMLVGVLCFCCLPIAVLQAILYYYTFKYIGWFGIPALTIANLLMWMFIEDDEEPRTKTISSNEVDQEEVEENDENDPVAGAAQDVSACDHGPDSDGDPEDEGMPGITKEEAEKILERLMQANEIVYKGLEELESYGYDADSSAFHNRLINKDKGATKK